MPLKTTKKKRKRWVQPPLPENPLLGDPEWEAMKAARNNYTHNEAVQLVEYLENQYRKMWRSNMPSPVDVNELIRTLTERKIPFVITGAYGISGWLGKPRATHDVDILVKGGRNFSRTLKAVRDLYPLLEEVTHTTRTAFYLPGEKDAVIDVVFPNRRDQEETLALGIWTEDKTEKLRYRVPTLETALANKYGAIKTPPRGIVKRTIDVADFSQMVLHSTDKGREPIDLEKLESLGELVNPGKGGKEILHYVELVKAGRPIPLE